MFRRLSILFALLLISTSIVAGTGPAAVRKQVESSLSVTGSVDITPSGDVVAHRLDQPEKLPKGIVDMVARIAPLWKFEPVALQGNAVSRSTMSLLFVGKKREDGNYSIELRSAAFAGDSGESVLPSPTGNRALAYPMSLQRLGVTGAVFLQLKIGRDGKVMNIDASHVNLRVIGSEADMKRWRDAFVRSSIATVKEWTFVVPQSGPGFDTGYWFGTLPIEYSMEHSEKHEYGRWQTYVPGPKTLIPWLQDSQLADGDADALMSNRFHEAGTGRRLLTPLGGG